MWIVTPSSLVFWKYCEVLRRRHVKVRRLRPQLWREKSWLLHHDDAPSHTFVLTHQFVAKKQNFCYSPPTVLPWFGILWLLTISKNEIEAERTPVRFHWGDQGWIAESAWHSDRRRLPGSVSKMETVGPASTCGRELLRGWRRPIGFMVSFMNFTAPARKILDQPSYV